MKFGPDHYVPILKVKQGEKDALMQLAPEVRARLTPLLEIIVRNTNKDPEEIKTVDEHLNTTFKNLKKAVAAFPRYLLDCREIAPDGSAAANEAFDRATQLGVGFTPVTGLTRVIDQAAALAHRKNGIALRLTRDELESGLIRKGLPAFVKKHSLATGDVDLLLDLGSVEDLVTPGIVALATAFLDDVPDKGKWRTLTISGCAFPLSMGTVDRDSFDLVERSEWHAWRDGLHAARDDLERLPSFSDCAIQHPSGVEGFDHKTMQVSAAIRYTLPDHWLRIKGASRKVTPFPIQFEKLATELVYGHLSEHFAEPKHCRGCGNAKDAANGADGLGSLGVWRRLGTIHHLTRTVEGIAALTWP